LGEAQLGVVGEVANPNGEVVATGRTLLLAADDRKRRALARAVASGLLTSDEAAVDDAQFSFVPSPEAAVSVALDAIHDAFQAAGYDPGPMLKSIELLEPAEA